MNPYNHTTLFNFFLWEPHTDMDGLTMFDLVSTGGGENDVRKAARNLVAAYLNASFGINYPFTTTQLIDMWDDVNDQVGGGTGDFLGLHTTLSAANRLGCPIS